MDLAGVDVGEVPTERLSPRTQPQRPRRRILGEKAGLDAWPTRSSPGMPDNPAKATGDRRPATGEILDRSNRSPTYATGSTPSSGSAAKWFGPSKFGDLEPPAPAPSACSNSFAKRAAAGHLQQVARVRRHANGSPSLSKNALLRSRARFANRSYEMTSIVTVHVPPGRFMRVLVGVGSRVRW